MKKAFIYLALVLSIFAFFVPQAFAFVIDVNGRLNEWGVTPGIYGASQWMPYAGILYDVEDNNPAVSSVGPGSGGQNYDVEAIYLTVDSANLYYAIVTGFPPGGFGSHFPGDIAFDFGIDNTYEYGISSITRNGYTAGNLYRATAGWKYGSWPAISGPSYMKSGGAFASSSGSLIYTNSYYQGNHYVIEGYIPHLAFSSDWGRNVRMHWTMSCGNDYLNVDYIIPEPATLSLLGLGLLGLLGLKKRRV